MDSTFYGNKIQSNLVEAIDYFKIMKCYWGKPGNANPQVKSH